MQRRQTTTRKSPHHPIERLESRELLSVSMQNGYLYVAGTQMDDQIYFTLAPQSPNTLLIDDNGYISYFDVTSLMARIKAVYVTTGFGGDRVEVDQSHGAIRLSFFMEGGDGDDTLISGSGNDVLVGGNQNDYLIGNDGNDRLDGGSEDDTLEGGNGNDHLYGREGYDSLLGGAHNDSIYGDDSLVYGLLGDPGNDDYIHGGKGNDILHGGNGADLIFGGDGYNQFYGERGNDTCEGGAKMDFIWGGEGDDSLLGNGGNDQIWGELGSDILDGGGGGDSLDGGGGGSDEVYGDSASDLFVRRSGQYTDFNAADRDRWGTFRSWADRIRW